MPTRQLLIRIPVDAATAAVVRLHAEQAGQSISEWIAGLLRREVLHAGAANPLAARSLETSLTVAYMLRALMIDCLGAEAAERIIEQAAGAAAEEIAVELIRMGGPLP